MKVKEKVLVAALLIAAAALLALPPGAQATNTASGTVITNAATVQFEVGGVLQSAVTGTNTFTVDNKVNLLVTKIADASVIPNSTNRALVFTVTNLGNTTQGYALNVISRGTNSFNTNPNPPRIYLDGGGTPNAWDAGDTLYVDATTAGFSNVISGATITVLVVGDIPIGRTNGETASYDLVATTVNAGTITPTAQTVGANTAGVDVVYADTPGSAGAGTDDNRDGKHSAFATFTITATVVTVGKTATVYWDPFNLLVNPKAIPGAIITYTVTVTNTGGQNATNVSITDDLHTDIDGGRTVFATQFIDAVNSCAAGEGLVVNGACAANAGRWDAATKILSVTGLSAASGGGTAIIKYQVVVQ